MKTEPMDLSSLENSYTDQSLKSLDMTAELFHQGNYIVGHARHVSGKWGVSITGFGIHEVLVELERLTRWRYANVYLTRQERIVDIHPRV